MSLSILLTVVELHRGLPLLTLLSFVLIVVVASIPVALPAVLSVTMALGALALSRMKAIVSRLEVDRGNGRRRRAVLRQDRHADAEPLTLGDPVRWGSGRRMSGAGRRAGLQAGGPGRDRHTR